MKKYLSVITVVLLSSILIALTLYIKDTPTYTNDEVSNFLDRDEKNYKIGNIQSDYTLTEINNIGKKGFFYKKITPIDGIYYHSDSPSPIITSKNKNGKYIINISEGIYIFSLNDIFNKYEIIGSGLSITQLGKGIFIVINKNHLKRVYSFNSLLNIKLVTEKVIISSFNLFPSLLFEYNPKYNDKLKGADILRIATINNIFYLDFKNPSFVTNLFTGKDESKGKELLDMFNHDIKRNFTKFSKLYKDIISSKDSDINGETFINNYPFLFLNDTKKDIYLKNLLSKNLIHFFANKQNLSNEAISQKNSLELQNNIKEIFNEMKTGDVLYSEGLEILKNYFYISFYGSLLKNNENVLFQDKNNLLKMMKDMIPSISGDEYFSTLSDIYLSYIISDLDKKYLDNYIDSYLGNLLMNKTIGKNDFLTFSFFLTEYLDTNINTSKYSLNILFHLFDISNSYYDSLGNDNNRKFSLISIEFFNYSKILSKLNDRILDTYFLKKEKGFILKPEFGGENLVDIPEEELDKIKKLYKIGSKGLLEKKDLYYKNLGNISSLSDSYLILKNKFLKLRSIITILNDYSSYIIKINLNSENKHVKGLDFIEDNNLNISKLEKYLGQFNYLDIGSLKILNNYKKDGFYNVSINILNYLFNFKLNPNGYVVYDLIYNDKYGNQNNKFKGLPVSFEEKEKYLKDLYNMEQNPLNKKKYDFKNIFLITYLQSDEQNLKNVGSIDQTDIAEMPIELKLFIQNELINKDFKYLDNILDVKFQNINAKIENGEYQIYLKNIINTFNSGDNSYTIDLNSSYIFKEHSFTNIKMKIKKNDGDGFYDFNSNEVTVIPDKIFVKDLKGKIKDIGYYIDTLKFNYKENSANLKIDLNLKKVFIDSEGFNVKFNEIGN